MHRSLVGCLGLFALAFPTAARALDAFEIQVYDGTANPPRVPGLELHLNAWPTGHRSATAPELPLHGQVHATLEPSLGLLPFWEIGAYLQTALLDDGAFDWAGVKLRSKFVTPPGFDDRWRLGVNVEVSFLPEAFERDSWGLEVRPIVAWTDDTWLFAFNPIVDQSLAGAGASLGPSLEPALKAWRSLGPFALGFEYYGSLGPVAAPDSLRDQEHYVFGVLDWLSANQFEFNAGVGAGLTPASAGVVFKAILGYTFDAPATRPPASASFPLRGSSVRGPCRSIAP